MLYGRPAPPTLSRTGLGPASIRQAFSFRRADDGNLFDPVGAMRLHSRSTLSRPAQTSRKLPPSIVLEIVRLRSEAMSLKAIAKRTGLTFGIVYHTLQRLAE